MKPIDIAPADLEIVQRILSQYVPSLEVRAFGSRVTWNARATSDLDLALFTTEPLDFALKAELRETFAQSNLPFRVDIVDWAATPEDFQEVIAQEYVVISRALSEKQRGTDKLMETTLGNCTINETAHSPKTVWPLVEIGTIAQIEGGSTPSTRNPDNFGGGIAWITPKDLSTTQFRFLSEGSRTLSSQGLKNCSARLVPRGTVLLSTRAPIGLVAIASKELATNQGIRNLIPSKDVTSEYLYYWLKANTAVLEQHAAGTTFSELSGTALRRIQLRLPPLPEQKAITYILETLDDRIVLNHRMNQTLEEMARALFKSWFVNFDPVHVKMEKCWLADQSFLDQFAEFYPFFPKQVANSEIGNIPEGWKVGKLSDISKLLKRRISPSDLDLQTPYIGLEHMPKRSIALTNWGKASKVKSSKSGFRKGEILFGKLRPYFHKVGISPIDGICSTDILVLAPISHLWLSFLLLCVSDSKFIRYVDQNATGTRMPRTDWKKMKSYKICLPPKDIIEAFQNITQVLIDQIVANVHEIKMLTNLRNTLLPKILSGPVRNHSNMQRLGVSSSGRNSWNLLHFK